MKHQRTEKASPAPQFQLCEGSGQLAWLSSSATSVATIFGQCPICARGFMCLGGLSPLHIRPLLPHELMETEEATACVEKDA